MAASDVLSAALKHGLHHWENCSRCRGAAGAPTEVCLLPLQSRARDYIWDITRKQMTLHVRGEGLGLVSSHLGATNVGGEVMALSRAISAAFGCRMDAVLDQLTT